MSKDIKVGDWVRIEEGARPQYPDSIGVEFKVRTVVDCGHDVFDNGHRYATGKGFPGGVWFKHLKRIQTATPVEEDAPASRELNIAWAYRKELIGTLNLNIDARPIIQAKLSAVNQIIKRIGEK